MLKFDNGDEVMILGFRIYYGDGFVATGRVRRDWEAAPLEDVQVVLIFYNRTYSCWCDEKLETFNYVEQLHGFEYYWFSLTAGYGGAPRDPVPVDATIKHGRTSENFREIYNRALQDRKWL